MSSAPLPQCANCGVDATMKCTGCVDAPEYQVGDSASTMYCNSACQTTHWPTHKSRCRSLGKRKKLLRAAKILKAALLTYTEIVFDDDLKKIECLDGVLYLHHNRNPDADRLKRGLFPDHLTTNVEHKEAALAYNQCSTAMALLGRLTRELLKGACSLRQWLRLTTLRYSFNNRGTGPPHRKATGPNKTHPRSRPQPLSTHSIEGRTVHQ